MFPLLQAQYHIVHTVRFFSAEMVVEEEGLWVSSLPFHHLVVPVWKCCTIGCVEVVLWEGGLCSRRREASEGGRGLAPYWMPRSWYSTGTTEVRWLWRSTRREARMRELNGEKLSDRRCSGRLACLMPNLPADGLPQTESLELKPSRPGIVVEGSVAMEAITNLPQAICFLFGFTYALHLDSPSV